MADLKPGIHTIPEADYHADLIDDERPSLSASIANILVSQTPLHAWTAHPRLNPDYERREDKKYDLGTAVHAMLLEGRDIVQVVDKDDWRTNDAKAQRDEAYAAGLTPLLAKNYERALHIYEAALRQIERHEAQPPLLADGKPEQTIVWEEDGILCRSLVDWLHDDHAAIDDVKTTSRSADPEQWSRSTLWGIGADVQVAFHSRGVWKLTGRKPEWRYIAIETSPPFALSVISLMPAALALGEAKVERALKLWRQCLEADSWPGYPRKVCYADTPTWEEMRWLEKEAREEMAA